MSNETKALILYPDGTHQVIGLPKNNSEQLRAMQGHVGGYIEAVYGWTRDPEEYAADVTFFCNEEGKLQNQPVNAQASSLWWVLNPDARGADHLCGVVVVTGGADRNGNTLPVPDKVVEVVERVGGA